MLPRLWLCTSLLGGSLVAQTTWVVNAGGGPGVSFTDLPSAVAAATDGDTILVQAGPFLAGATGFTTSKGLTIVGEGGLVPIYTSPSSPIRIVNLPATSVFRMCGFSRPGNGELDIEIDNCAGPVHLERMRCREYNWFAPTYPTTRITNSANVTLREYGTYGAPAVDIVNSTVSMVRCRLGKTYIGISGGQCVRSSASVVDIVEPLFDTGWGAAQAIECTNTDLRLAGSPASYVINPAGPAIVANGGSVVVDPAVSLTVGTGFPAIAGSATVNTQSVPATSTDNAQPGQTLTIDTSAAAGAVVFHALGTPAPLTSTPLGTLGIDVAQGYAFLSAVVVGGTGSASSSLMVPGTLPLGEAFTTQAVVFAAGSLALSLPCTFVVH